MDSSATWDGCWPRDSRSVTGLVAGPSFGRVVGGRGVVVEPLLDWVGVSLRGEVAEPSSGRAGEGRGVVGVPFG